MRHGQHTVGLRWGERRRRRLCTTRWRRAGCSHSTCRQAMPLSVSFLHPSYPLQGAEVQRQCGSQGRRGPGAQTLHMTASTTTAPSPVVPAPRPLPAACAPPSLSSHRSAHIPPPPPPASPRQARQSFHSTPPRATSIQPRPGPAPPPPPPPPPTPGRAAPWCGRGPVRRRGPGAAGEAGGGGGGGGAAAGRCLSGVTWRSGNRTGGRLVGDIRGVISLSLSLRVSKARPSLC